jgi:hypothetical protein
MDFKLKITLPKPQRQYFHFAKITSPKSHHSSLLFLLSGALGLADASHTRVGSEVLVLQDGSWMLSTDLKISLRMAPSPPEIHLWEASRGTEGWPHTSEEFPGDLTRRDLVLC